MANKHDPDTEKHEKRQAAGEAGRHPDSSEKAREKAGAEAARREKEMNELRGSLERKTSECTEYRDTLLRLQAEFENYRKRMVREQTQFLERAVEGFVLQLLPIVDNLERAISAAEEKHDLEQLADGVKITHAQIVDLFKKEGIEIIDPVGQPFDPTEMHAMLSIEDEEHPDATVLEVIQKGYRLKGKVIRPAMVKVSKLPE